MDVNTAIGILNSEIKQSLLDYHNQHPYKIARENALDAAIQALRDNTRVEQANKERDMAIRREERLALIVKEWKTEIIPELRYRAERAKKDRDYFQQDYIEQSKRAGILQRELLKMREQRDKAILMLKAEENESLESYEDYEEQLRQLRDKNEILRSALKTIAAINIDDKYDKFNRPLIWDIVTTARKTLDFTKEDDND